MSDHPEKVVKSIFICGDIWLSLFHLLPPDKVGLEIALLSCRFDALVDEHFKTRHWTLGIIEIQNKFRRCYRATGKAEMEILNAEGNVIPIPDRPLPNKVVGFGIICTDYIDQNVMAFLCRFRHLLASHATKVKICAQNDCASEYIVNNFCPLLSGEQSANASDGHTPLVKWLLRSSPYDNDGFVVPPPKVLIWAIHLSWEWSPKIQAIKSSFVNASSRASFIIVIAYALANPIEPFCLTNELTGEQLTLERRCYYAWPVWLIRRCPIARDQHKWAKWEKEAIKWRGMHQSKEWTNISIFLHNSEIRTHTCPGLSAAYLRAMDWAVPVFE